LTEATPTRPRLSIVIPTFGRAKALADHVGRIRAQVARDFSSDVFEIILVDDHSPDNSWPAIESLCRQWPEIRGVHLAWNSGQQHATLAGLRASSGMIAVTMDDDGKDNPADIRRLVDNLEQGLDVVYAVPGPAKKAKGRWIRRLGTAAKEWLVDRLCHKPPGIRLTSFRALSRPSLDRLCADKRSHVYLSATLLEQPVRIGQVAVTGPEGPDLPSGYTLGKLLRLILQLAWHYGPWNRPETPAKAAQYVIDQRCGWPDVAEKSDPNSQSNAKTLMMLGASLAQLPGIRLAKAMGHRVVTCDDRPDSIGHREADAWAMASTFDSQAVLLAARTHRIDGIMTMGSDQPVLTAAQVAAALKLPGALDVETARSVTDKRFMKARFMALGLPTVPSVVLGREKAQQGCTDFLSGLVSPLVIKPVDSQGQRGIYVVDSPRMALDRLEDVLSFSRSDEILVEQYYPGDEVTVSAWIHAGQTTVLALTDRISFQDRDRLGVCLSHEWPSRHRDQWGPELVRLTKEITKGFDLPEGPFYGQFLIGDKGVLINEIACRIGGAFESQFIPRLTGFDLTATQIALALGQEPTRDQWAALERCDVLADSRYLSVQLFFANPCTIARLTPLEAVRACPGVLDAGYHVKEGQTMPLIQDATARIGYCIVEAESKEQLELRLKALYNVLHVIDTAGENQIIHRPLEV
jgi:biotin carboxylase